MKRNDWAGGFWAKAAAFFLAVVLVPVLLSYGAALAFSYSGELRGKQHLLERGLPRNEPRLRQLSLLCRKRAVRGAGKV